MNLDNTLECSYPFKHWELSECLDNETLNEISLLKFQMEKGLMMEQEQLTIQAKV